jgi:hypothetical protein
MSGGKTIRETQQPAPLQLQRLHMLPQWNIRQTITSACEGWTMQLGTLQNPKRTELESEVSSLE